MESDFELAKDGSAISVLRVAGRRGYEIVGDRSTVHMMAALVPLILLVLLTLGYLYHLQAIRPWYERKVEESGGGRLSTDKDMAPECEAAIPQ